MTLSSNMVLNSCLALVFHCFGAYISVCWLERPRGNRGHAWKLASGWARALPSRRLGERRLGSAGIDCTRKLEGKQPSPLWFNPVSTALSLPGFVRTSILTPSMNWPGNGEQNPLWGLEAQVISRSRHRRGARRIQWGRGGIQSWPGKNWKCCPFPLIISFWSFPLRLCGHAHSCVECSAPSICISHTDDVCHRVWGAACGMSRCSQEPEFSPQCSLSWWYLSSSPRPYVYWGNGACVLKHLMQTISLLRCLRFS